MQHSVLLSVSNQCGGALTRPPTRPLDRRLKIGLTTIACLLYCVCACANNASTLRMLTVVLDDFRGGGGGGRMNDDGGWGLMARLRWRSCRMRPSRLG